MVPVESRANSLTLVAHVDSDRLLTACPRLASPRWHLFMTRGVSQLMVDLGRVN